MTGRKGHLGEAGMTDVYYLLRSVVSAEMAVLSTEDEGKFLMDAHGEQIGIVTQVDPGGADRVC